MMKHFSKAMYTLILSLLLVIVAGVSQAAAANLLRVLVREESGSKMSVAVTQPSTLQASGQASRRLDPGKWYTLPLTSAYRITPSNNGLVQVGSNLYPARSNCELGITRRSRLTCYPLRNIFVALYLAKCLQVGIWMH